MPNPSRILRTTQLIEGAGLPLNLNELESAGVSVSSLRAARDRGTVQRLAPGMYGAERDFAQADAKGRHLILARAWLSRHPRAVASHDTAALLHGLPLLTEMSPGPIHLASAKALHPHPDLRVHQARIPDSHVARVHGASVTSLARTAVDLACAYGPLAGLIACDAATRMLIAGTSDLLGSAVRCRVRDREHRSAAVKLLSDVVEQGGRRVGLAHARTAIEWCDPASESVLESLSRFRFREAGLPAPECGVAHIGADGRTYWTDATWDFARVIGEADGLSKYTDPDVLRREKLRQEALENAGWTVVRWGWSDVRTRPELLIRRLERALDRGRRPQN